MKRNRNEFILITQISACLLENGIAIFATSKLYLSFTRGALYVCCAKLLFMYFAFLVTYLGP